MIVASLALHNFICQEEIIDNLFVEYDIEGAMRDDENDYDEDDAMSSDNELMRRT